jgi:diguanylate cyclase (GGDEF)-like protein
MVKHAMVNRRLRLGSRESVPISVRTHQDQQGRAVERPIGTFTRAAWTWGEETSRRAVALVRSLGRAVERDRVVHEFADIIAEARDASEIESALVRLAHEVAGSSRVELYVDARSSEAGATRRVAWLPEASACDAGGPTGELTPPRDLSLTRSPTGLVRLVLRSSDRFQGTLWILPAAGRPLSRRTLRLLTTLCTMAAAARRGFRGERLTGREPLPHFERAVRDATFLNAVLPFALAQAYRYREPVSLFCVSVDRLAAILDLHGRATADATVQRVAETISRTLRASDVVSRLDDDRIIAMLPNASATDAVSVAEIVRLAVATASASPQDMPVLSVSIGVAGYPANAHDVLSLIDTADEALVRAQARGPNQVAASDRKPHP